MNKLLVVGGSGRVGRYLVKNLQSKTIQSFGTFNKNIISDPNFFKLSFDNLKNNEFDFSAFTGIVISISPVDLAGSSHAPDEEYIHQYEKFLNELFQSLSKTNEVRKIIFLSTAVVYEQSDEPSTSNEGLNCSGLPAFPYERVGIAVRKMEKKFNEILCSSDKDLYILRLSTVYGAPSISGVVRDLVDKIKITEENALLKINGSSRTQRNFLHIDFIIEVISHILNSNKKVGFTIANIASNEHNSVFDLINSIKYFMKKHVEIEFLNEDQSNYRLVHNESSKVGVSSQSIRLADGIERLLKIIK